jgi:hypothetical protein
MSVAVASVEKINALKTGIEATTGESYNDLTEAVQSLKNGYGQSGGGEVGRPYIDTSKITDFYQFAAKNRFNDSLENIDTSNGTNFESMFNNSDTLTEIPLLDTSKGTTFKSMFNYCRRLTTIPALDVSNSTNFENMFENCGNLVSVPALNTSKGERFTQMFRYCTNLVSVLSLDTSNFLTGQRMFYDCKKLETLSLTTSPKDFDSTMFGNCTALANLTIGEGWAVSIYLTGCSALTQESLHGMIENLADLTGSTAKIFQIGSTNLAKIDEEHIAMLQAKNWTYS